MVEIKKEYLEQIVAAAKERAPDEICGILAGRGNKVEKVYQLTNIADRPENCYLIDPKEQLQLMKELRSKRWELVGIYHSHPYSAAYPSARDVELAFYPDATYVIVSLEEGKPQVRAFHIVEEEIKEEVITS